MRQIINIITIAVVLCATLACGEKQEESLKKTRGNYIESPIIYRDKTMLTVVSQYSPGNDKVKISAERRLQLICDHLSKNGWLSRNVNYPSLRSILMPADEMYKGWTICIINVINQPTPFKSRTVMQCRVDLGRNSFLIKEFDHDLPDENFLKEFEGILSGLIASAQFEAKKIKGE